VAVDLTGTITALSKNLEKAESAITAEGTMSIAQMALNEQMKSMVDEAKKAIAEGKWREAIDGLEKAEGKYKSLEGFTEFYDNFVLSKEVLNIFDPDEGSEHFGRAVNPGNVADTLASGFVGGLTLGGIGNFVDQAAGKYLGGSEKEPFQDTNKNNRYDDGEPFTDLNKDGKWSPGGLVLGPTYAAIDKGANLIADTAIGQGIQKGATTLHENTVAPIVNWQPVDDGTYTDQYGEEQTLSGKPFGNIAQSLGKEGFMGMISAAFSGDLFKSDYTAPLPASKADAAESAHEDYLAELQMDLGKHRDEYDQGKFDEMQKILAGPNKSVVQDPYEQNLDSPKYYDSKTGMEVGREELELYFNAGKLQLQGTRNIGFGDEPVVQAFPGMDMPSGSSLSEDDGYYNPVDPNGSWSNNYINKVLKDAGPSLWENPWAPQDDGMKAGEPGSDWRNNDPDNRNGDAPAQDGAAEPQSSIDQNWTDDELYGTWHSSESGKRDGGQWNYWNATGEGPSDGGRWVYKSDDSDWLYDDASEDWMYGSKREDGEMFMYSDKKDQWMHKDEFGKPQEEWNWQGESHQDKANAYSYYTGDEQATMNDPLSGVGALTGIQEKASQRMEEKFGGLQDRIDSKIDDIMSRKGEVVWGKLEVATEKADAAAEKARLKAEDAARKVQEQIDRRREPPIREFHWG
jgi:hypothetical protein